MLGACCGVERRNVAPYEVACHSDAVGNAVVDVEQQKESPRSGYKFKSAQRLIAQGCKGAHEGSGEVAFHLIFGHRHHAHRHGQCRIDILSRLAIVSDGEAYVQFGTLCGEPAHGGIKPVSIGVWWKGEY